MKEIVLETPRLQLREMSLADMHSLAVILQDERVMYAYNGAFSDAETLAWMQKQLRRYREFGFGLWAVLKRDTGEMIGQCGITMQEYRNTQVPEIGYLFAYKHWHQGYATEAAIACREYGFNALHFDALYSIIRDTNIPSQNVALRNGMKKIDSFVKHYRGEEMPHWVYRVEKDKCKKFRTYHWILFLFVDSLLPLCNEQLCISMSKENQDIALFISFCIEQYKTAKGLTGEEAMRILSHYGVLDYLNEFYDVLHTQGGQWLLADMDEFIANRKKEEGK